MENYKIRIQDVEVDEEDFTNSKILDTYKDLDSGIPKCIVDKIQERLQEQLDTGLSVGPMLVKVDTLDLIFNILETTEENTKVNCNVIINK